MKIQIKKRIPCWLLRHLSNLSLFLSALVRDVIVFMIYYYIYNLDLEYRRYWLVWHHCHCFSPTFILNYDSIFPGPKGSNYHQPKSFNFIEFIFWVEIESWVALLMQSCFLVKSIFNCASLFGISSNGICDLLEISHMTFFFYQKVVGR